MKNFLFISSNSLCIFCFFLFLCAGYKKQRQSGKNHVELVTRFIYRMVNESKAFDLSKLKFKQRERPLKIAYHTPCHLEKLGWEYYSIELLRMIPNIDITVLKPNCCGIGGTYGFKKENYENAQKIGEPLFREIEEGGFDLVVSDCETW